MRKILLLCLIVIFPALVRAADTISVPWEEIKTLYRESIERKIEDSTPQPAIPQTHTIEEAVYELQVGEQHTEGTVVISGKVISGGPEPIGLFDKEIIISAVNQMSGGSLITSTTDCKKILFLPDGTGKEFQISLSFMVGRQEDNRSKMVSFAIPAALRNSLRLSLPPESSLIETPGLADSQGIFHFSMGESLVVRYADREDLKATALIEIDTFNRIQPQGRRVVVTTHFVPVQPVSQALTLQVQPGAQFISSSLKPSWINKTDDSNYEIRLPSGEPEAFSIGFGLDESESGSFTMQLPTIKENRGKEGDFVVEEPDDGQVSVSGSGLVMQNPVSRLGKRLATFAGKSNTTLFIPSGEMIRLDVKRFQTVSAPAIVLESQYLFTSFEENGISLSVLVMEVPPQIGPRISIRPVAGAQIWSLKVNGNDRKVYTDSGNNWIIPLEEGQMSQVELALLCKSEKLGLHGRLETTLPETGLAARSLCIGIALPERVQLMSLEGPVSPAPGAQWRLPADFIGKPYLFSRSFHKGEEIKLAVSYKEPVKP